MNDLLGFFRITGTVLGLLMLASCDKGNQQEGSWSHFFGLVDTVTVRDTVIVDKEVILHDTVKVEKKIVLRDTVVVEKEVIKRVEVPAEIPQRYKEALEQVNAESYAFTAYEGTVFRNINNLSVSVELNDDAQDVVFSQSARDKFELILRQSNIPISDYSNFFILLKIQVVKGDITSAFVVEVSLRETVIIYRDGMPYKRTVSVWRDFMYGFAGKNKIRDSVLDGIEYVAERVSNLYLSSNPR